jgi:hypothetical protein
VFNHWHAHSSLHLHSIPSRLRLIQRFSSSRSCRPSWLVFSSLLVIILFFSTIVLCNVQATLTPLVLTEPQCSRSVSIKINKTYRRQIECLSSTHWRDSVPPYYHHSVLAGACAATIAAVFVLKLS